MRGKQDYGADGLGGTGRVLYANLLKSLRQCDFESRVWMKLWKEVWEEEVVKYVKEGRKGGKKRKATEEDGGEGKRKSWMWRT